MKDVVASTRGADMPSRLESFRARCALALRFCAAAALGLAIVVGLSVVWSVAVFLQAIVGGEPTRPSLERSTSYFTSHRLGAAEGAS
jgi:hypothetical protein